ncbi:MAG TPA: hypothetical protein VI455_01505 [Terriglobia bacterium]
MRPMRPAFKLQRACLLAAFGALGLSVTVRLPAAAIPCAQCHPKEVAGFAATPMGRSLGRPEQGPSAKFTHALSKTQFSIETSDTRMIQRLARDGLKGEHEVAYAVGSGAHAYAYLIERDGHLFQSPLGYFAGRGWGMSPGYEDSKAPDFERPVTADCLFCHSGRARPVAGTYNTYQDPPFEGEAITCERCHGPAEVHLRAPLPGSIINPAKLSPRARDSTCEQCHLIGEERVPSPGKQLSDFRPGEELEEVFSVYVAAVSRDPSHGGGLKVVSQVQQLALSKCALQSHGRLWCGTCHDPHATPADAKSYFRARCLACHGAALLKTHPKPNDDCVGCHMPRRPVTDGAHTIFTDHHIARRPLPQSSAKGAPGRDARQSPGVPEAPAALIAWHDPPSAVVRRNLGLAEVKVGDRSKSFPLVNQGFQLLLDCWPNFPDDPPLLSAIGQALLGAGHPSEAAAVYEQAIQIEPKVAINYLHAALAWKAVPDAIKAIDYLNKTQQLDPLLEEPYIELADIYDGAHDGLRVHKTLERYLKAFPQSIRAQKLARESAER